MTDTTETPTPELGTAEATADAKAKLDEAQSALDVHLARLSDAEAKAEELAEDPTDATQTQFTTAVHAVAYLSAGVNAREAALDKARHHYRTAVAAQTAVEVGEDAATRWGMNAMPEVRASLHEAVRKYRDLIANHNANRSRTIARLLDAGLVHEEADPFAPATAHRRDGLSDADRLYLYGSEVPGYNLAAALDDEVKRALAVREEA